MRAFHIIGACVASFAVIFAVGSNTAGSESAIVDYTIGDSAQRYWVSSGETLGFAFTPATDIAVTALGFSDLMGNGFTIDHHLGLWTADGEPLATGTLGALEPYIRYFCEDPQPQPVPASYDQQFPLVDRYRYVSVEPIHLLAGHTYIIGATVPLSLDAIGYEGCWVSLGDMYDLASEVDTLVHGAAIEVLGYRKAVTPGVPSLYNVLTFPDAQLDDFFLGVNFQYEVVPTPSVAAYLLCAFIAAATGGRDWQYGILHSGRES